MNFNNFLQKVDNFLDSNHQHGCPPNSQPGYPGAPAGYPAPGYPGYPNTQPGYPAASGYPAPGYPGYPNTQPGYPSYPNSQPGYGGFTPVQITFSSDSFFPNGNKKYDSFFKDFYLENGKKVFERMQKRLYYENGQLAYDGFHTTPTIYYMNGKKAYEGFFNRAFYPNGNQLGGQGYVTDPGFEMRLQDNKNGEFSIHLSRNYFARVYMVNGKMRFNVFLDGQCIIAE